MLECTHTSISHFLFSLGNSPLRRVHAAPPGPIQLSAPNTVCQLVPALCVPGCPAAIRASQQQFVGAGCRRPVTAHGSLSLHALAGCLMESSIRPQQQVSTPPGLVHWFLTWPILC